MTFFFVAVFVFMNLLVIASARIIAERILRVARGVDLFIAVLLLFFAQIAATEMFLGLSGRLSLAWLIGVNAGIYVFLRYSVRRIVLGRLGVANAARDFLNLLLSDWLLRFVFVFLLVFASVKLLINLVNPPFGWDSLNYHFTFPVEWIKSKTLDIPITVFDDPSPSYYPINGSLFFLWFMLPFGNVFIADCAQLPFFILASACVHGIARNMGIREKDAIFASALFALIPNFFKQLQIAYVDVMLAALLLACVYYLFLLEKEYSPKNLLGFALAAGLALGVKTLAIVYVAILFIPFLWLTMKARVEKRFVFFLLSCLLVMLLGGFTYAKNFIETGNPFYPLKVVIAGLKIFPGVINPAVYRAHFKPEDYRLAKLLFHEGLGVQSTLFVLPGALLALPFVFLKRKKMPGLFFGYMLLTPLLFYLAYRYLIPLPNVRYLYACLGLGLSCGFYLYREAGVPERFTRLAIFLCAAASVTELAKKGELAASAVIAILAFSLSIPLLQYINRQKFNPLSRPALVCVFLLIVFFGGLLNLQYVRSEYAGYVAMRKYSGFWEDAAVAWKWLNDNTSGDNIAYAGRPVPFPLYGSGFKNNVYYVSVNGTDPAKLHYFGKGSYSWGYDFESVHESFQKPGNYRGNPQYALWHANLLRRKTDYLFVYSLHQTKEALFPLEDAWAQEHPEDFAQVFEYGNIRIYKVLG